MILTNKERNGLKEFLEKNDELAEELALDVLNALLSPNVTVSQVLTEFMDIHLTEEKPIPEGAALYGTIRN
jgi:hypothetical protein